MHHFQKLFDVVSTWEYRVWGLAFKILEPIKVNSYVINRFQSRGVEKSLERTTHLITVGYK